MKQNHLPETLLVDCSEETWVFRQLISSNFDDIVPLLEATVEAAANLKQLKETTRQMVVRIGDELMDLGEKNLHEQLKVSYMLYTTVDALVSKFIKMNLYVNDALVYKLRNVRDDHTMVFVLAADNP